MSNTVLDVTGLSCPLPVLRAKKALKQVAVGHTLTVLATDPGSVQDMALFCHQTHNELVDTQTQDGVFTYVIRRSERF